MTDDEVDDAAAALLQRANHRYTKGRRRLVAALQAGDGPLTITEIVATDTTLPPSTVYRNLTILEDANVVTRVVTSDEYARFELAEHLTGHHHHLICRTCGVVTDFSLDPTTEATLERALNEAADKAGFTTDAHVLDLLGTCSACS